MHLIRIELHNFGPFVGHQGIDLSPGLYAVTARDSNDQTRSNWLGKSTFLSSVAFALYGLHGYRNEAGWITHGEDEGGVRLFLSDGSVVERTRGKKGATVVSLLTGEQTWTGEQAQQKINQKIGLDQKDFLFTAFLQQRQMARFVLCSPAERLEIVSGWLGLDRLVSCASRIKSRIQDTERLLTKLDTERNIIRHRLSGRDLPEASLLQVKTIAEVMASAHLRKTELDQEIKSLEIGKRQELEAELERSTRFERRKEWLDSKEAFEGELDTLKKSAPSTPLEVMRDREAAKEADLNDLRVKLHGHRKKVHDLGLTASGKFDGGCPVNGMVCPVKDKINQEPEAASKLLAVERLTLNKVEKELANANALYLEAREAVREEERRLGRLADLEDALKRIEGMLQDSLRPERTPKEVRSDMDTYIETLARKKVQADDLDKFIHLLTKSQSALDRIDSDIQKARSNLSLFREASVIFGKNGAQRRVAESALQVMETKANVMLLSAGIPLSLRVSWARPGTSLAEECEGCGFEFGASQRAKECPQCSAVRGPNLIQKLELEVSEQTTGAALDLVGMVFQLAASSWLRENRGSSWGVALLDEPFGQLDSHNRKALTSHLSGSLLADCGFDQAFIVAHHQSIMDALPGQIRITSQDGVSKLEVG